MIIRVPRHQGSPTIRVPSCRGMRRSASPRREEIHDDPRPIPAKGRSADDPRPAPPRRDPRRSASRTCQKEIRDQSTSRAAEERSRDDPRTVLPKRMSMIIASHAAEKRTRRSASRPSRRRYHDDPRPTPPEDPRRSASRPTRDPRSSASRPGGPRRLDRVISGYRGGSSRTTFTASKAAVLPLTAPRRQEIGSSYPTSAA